MKVKRIIFKSWHPMCAVLVVCVCVFGLKYATFNSQLAMSSLTTERLAMGTFTIFPRITFHILHFHSFSRHFCNDYYMQSTMVFSRKLDTFTYKSLIDLFIPIYFFVHSLSSSFHSITIDCALSTYLLFCFEMSSLSLSLCLRR